MAERTVTPVVTYQDETGREWKRMTEALVIEARARRAAGEQVLALAADYGVAQSVMSRALTGVTWSHV